MRCKSAHFDQVRRCSRFGQRLPRAWALRCDRFREKWVGCRRFTPRFVPSLSTIRRLSGVGGTSTNKSVAGTKRIQGSAAP